MGAVAAAVLAVALLVAGVGKLASPSWPAQAAGIGAPRWAASVVPWIEIVLGSLLVVERARPAVALAAAGLLVVFTGLLVLRLVQGRRPPCACFGGWSERPISWWSVGRNLGLIALAIVVALA